MGGGQVAPLSWQVRFTAEAVLVSAVTPYLMKTDDNSTGVEPSVFEGILSGLAVDRPHFLAGFGQKFFGNSLPNHKVSHEMLQWTLQMAMMGSLRATLECAKSFATTDFRPDMAAFDVTTMIIHGTADETVPIDSSARVAVGLIRNAYFVEYEGEPHGLHATAKHRLSRDLIDFIG